MRLLLWVMLGAMAVGAIVWLVATRAVHLPDLLSPPRQPSYVTPLPFEDAGEAIVTVSVSLVPGDELSAFAIEGRVTAQFLRVGDHLVCGGKLLAIDGHNVFLYCGDPPLWRAITPADAGMDVIAVERFLDSLGYDTAGAGEPSIPDLDTAIRAFRSDNGYAPGDEFAPGFVVYLPEDSVLADWNVRAGDRVGDGDPLARTVPYATSAAIDLPARFDRPGIVSIGGAEFDVVDRADGATTWSVDGIESLDPSLLSSADAGATAVELRGMYRFEDPLRGWALPLQSVLLSSSSCVIVSDRDSHEAKPVQVVSSSGEHIVVTGLDGLERVVDNPDTYGFSC